MLWRRSASDQQHAHVVGDGQQKLAQILRLLGLAGHEVKFLQLVSPSTSAPMSLPKI